jgi:MFS family permease
MTAPRRDAAATQDAAAGPRRRELSAGVMVFFADQFDIFLPVIALAAISAYFQPAGLSSTTSSVLTGFVFASALISRPIGAIVFGHLADTTGRKRATELAVLGFGTMTLLIALLPSSDQVGIWSIVGLVALRSASGVFVGGAYTAAIPLFVERLPAPRRGLGGGLLLAVSPLAYATLGVLTLAIHELLPGTGPDSAFALWGWRIPFVIGAALAFVALLRYHRVVAESAPGTLPAGNRPLRRLFGRHRATLMQVLVLMSGVSLANNMTLAVLPTLLGPYVGLTAAGVVGVMTLGTVLAAASFPAFGELSQRVGRRAFYLGYGVVIAVLGSGLYALLMLWRPSLPVTALLVGLIGLTTIGTYGPAAAYLCERFPTESRASGFGVGYSLALVVPGFYAVYLAGLGQLVPPYLAPSILLAVAGVLVGVGAAAGPETRDVDLHAGRDAVDGAEGAARGGPPWGG